MELYLEPVGYEGLLLLLLGIGFVNNKEQELWLLYGCANPRERYNTRCPCIFMLFAAS